MKKTAVAMDSMTAEIACSIASISGGCDMSNHSLSVSVSSSVFRELNLLASIYIGLFLT